MAVAVAVAVVGSCSSNLTLSLGTLYAVGAALKKAKNKNSYIEILTPKYDGTRGEACGRCTAHKGGALMNGIGALIENPQRSLHSSAKRGHREKMPAGNPGREPSPKSKHTHAFFFFFLSVFCLFRTTPTAYGGSQPRGPIGAVAAGLHHSQSNARSLTH